ncbi:uncharacterized protein METZ01_LOCUS134263 [marine metagenome]|uniref:Uncharacterized protein n=1 Tax=marine metagenome TaxID=408172 RepID=A0A381YWS9_9ZZZZ
MPVQSGSNHQLSVRSVLLKIVVSTSNILENLVN